MLVFKKIFVRKTIEGGKLITAREAFESTKAPQLENAIREINEKIASGHMYTYVGDHEKLHQETIDALLEKGYDLKISHFENDDMWFNQVFWDDEASGKMRKTKEF